MRDSMSESCTVDDSNSKARLSTSSVKRPCYNYRSQEFIGKEALNLMGESRVVEFMQLRDGFALRRCAAGTERER